MAIGRKTSRSRDNGNHTPGDVNATISHRPIPPKLYRIGEIVEYTGFSRQTIHNYTTMGLIRESQRSRGGHRLYDEKVFHRLETIAHYRAAKKSMKYIRQKLTPPADTDVGDEA